MTDAVLTIGSIGKRLDLNIRAGCTLGPYTVSFVDKDGAPINLTGASLVAKYSLIDQGAGAEISINATVTDAVNGKAQISFSAASTDSWDSSLTDAQAFAKTKKTFAWFCNWTDSLGTVRPLWYGYINVAGKKLP